MSSLTRLPFELGVIHFIGIAGIGMSGIAEVMSNLGYSVQGSDIVSSKITVRLQNIGINIFLGHNARNLENVEVAVVSSAIRGDNVELLEARQRGIPIVKRAEMLAELMRLKLNVAIAGTHGKTTTTSLVSAVFDKAGLDPTVINGGIIRAYNSNVRIGTGEWMVVEADESDGTFSKLPATVAIVTNIDREHLDHYDSFEDLKHSFDNFISNIPFYGVAICCIDNSEVHALVGRIKDRKIITYGFNKQADYSITEVDYQADRTVFKLQLLDKGVEEISFSLPMMGSHNVLNSVAAISLGDFLGLEIGKIQEALKNFSGVQRRFTHVDTINGVKIIDDYGHHPAEISAVLKSVRDTTTGRIIAVHQPHRFSRLKLLFDEFCTCFNDADLVLISDVYSAGEKELEGINKQALVDGLINHGHKRVFSLEHESQLKNFFVEHTAPGDVFVCLGAGSITDWANGLPSQIRNEKF